MTPPTVAGRRVVFLLDVDNTLLDNDRGMTDLKRYLAAEIGVDREERYWAIFEALRSDEDVELAVVVENAGVEELEFTCDRAHDRTWSNDRRAPCPPS